MSEAWNERDWVESQLDDARITGETREMICRLVDAYHSGTGAYRVDTKLAIDVVNKLVRGEALVAQDLPDEVWMPVRQSGQVHARDTVRVALDAYQDEAGRAHNGRRGRVIAVRYGDVVVRYEDGRQPPFDGVHHPPQKLEKKL